MSEIPATIDNALHAGFRAKNIGRAEMNCAGLSRWQLFDNQGHYLTEILCAVEENGNETVYWLSPSIRYSDDIEQLKELSRQAAIRSPEVAS